MVRDSRHRPQVTTVRRQGKVQHFGVVACKKSCLETLKVGKKSQILRHYMSTICPISNPCGLEAKTTPGLSEAAR